MWFTRHDDVIKWKHFPRYWQFVWGIHRSPVNSPQKGQWRGALMFSLICIRINGWVNNREAGDLRHHRAPYDVTLMVDFWKKNWMEPKQNWVKSHPGGHTEFKLQVGLWLIACVNYWRPLTGIHLSVSWPLGELPPIRLQHLGCCRPRG